MARQSASYAADRTVSFLASESDVCVRARVCVPHSQVRHDAVTVGGGHVVVEDRRFNCVHLKRRLAGAEGLELGHRIYSGHSYLESVQRCAGGTRASVPEGSESSRAMPCVQTSRRPSLDGRAVPPAGG